LNVIGMTVGTVLFLVVLMRFLDRQSWPLTIAVALVVAALNHLVFARWLHVPLPTGPFGL
jgi:hypothetical protein